MYISCNSAYYRQYKVHTTEGHFELKRIFLVSLVYILILFSQFNPPEDEVQDLYLGLILADGSKNIREALNKDVLIDSALLAIDISYYVMLMPDFVRKLVNFLANFFTKEYLPSKFIWDKIGKKLGAYNLEGISCSFFRFLECFKTLFTHKSICR